MMIIVGLVFVTAGLLATIIRRRVDIDRSAGIVQERYGLLLPRRLRSYPLGRFSQVVARKRTPMRHGTSNVRSRPVWDLKLVGEEPPELVLQTYRSREDAERESQRVADTLGIPCA